MYLEMGFMEATLAQDFCNGIPLGETVGAYRDREAAHANKVVTEA